MIIKIFLEGCSIKIFVDDTLIYVADESSEQLEKSYKNEYGI